MTATDQILRRAVEEAVDLEKELKKAESLVPQSVWLKLRKAFTPRGLPFFEFYILLKRIEMGEDVPDDIRRMFMRAANRLLQITSPVDGRNVSPAIANQIAEIRPEMNMLLGRLLMGRTEDNTTWRKITELFVPLFVAVARDKEVYIKARPYGPRRWGIIRRMTGKQESVEKLRDNDPEAYALTKKYNATLAEIDEGVKVLITRQGLEPETGFIMGRPVQYGINQETGEKLIFDRDGDVLTQDEYVTKRRENAEARKKMALIPTRTEVPVRDLLRLDPNDTDQLLGEMEWVSLTDDKAKQGRLTRIFPVKQKPTFIVDEDGDTEAQYHPVIVSGRFKGVYLDDMVNSQGRLIEGTAYTYSATTGHGGKVPVRIDPADREPYVTVADVTTVRTFKGRKLRQKSQKLFLKVPGSKDYTVLRNALKELACNVGRKRGCIPSITHEKVEGSRAAAFYLDPKDFGVVMETLQGMSLSASALELVKSYYKDLSNAEAATAEDNLTNYTAGNLGGFVTRKTDRETGLIKPFDLNVIQKQALAWMDANGGNGVLAPETGVGKTLIAIAGMQKLIRDGLADEDASYTRPDGKEIQTNGRFLFVCPPALKGNLPKEIRAFISDSKELRARVDIISYSEFSGSSKTGKPPSHIAKYWKRRRWNTALYVAIYFDEAHKMRNREAGAASAALDLWHPRKICLTASPMDKRPMDAYVLTAITNNTPLNGPSIEAKDNRKEMRRFKERFCETIGGRIVGVKTDPLVRRDLHTWVKRNIYYADKRNTGDELPPLQAENMVAVMPPQVEDAYRAVTDQFAYMMKGLATRFKDREKAGISGRHPDVERIFGKAFKPVVKLLNDLANHPEIALTDIAHMMRTETLPYPDKLGDPIPLPHQFKRALKVWATRFSPEELEAEAEHIQSPKLLVAEEVIRDKVDATDGASRALLFTDDTRLIWSAARHMAKKITGWHAVALKDEIHFMDGDAPIQKITFEMPRDLLAKMKPEKRDQVLAETGGVTTHTLPFHKKTYRRHPLLPAGPDNVHYKADNWQQFVLKEIITPDRRIRTLALYGPTYQYGHNLQAFDTVIHLDRDGWNSESMKQRTARAWRQGQDQPVDEITIDAVYDPNTPEAQTELDGTLDEIRRYFQEMDADVFNAIMREAQGLDLGGEWEGLARHESSKTRLNQDIMELMTSPYVGRVRGV